MPARQVNQFLLFTGKLDLPNQIAELTQLAYNDIIITNNNSIIINTVQLRRGIWYFPGLFGTSTSRILSSAIHSVFPASLYKYEMLLI